MFAAIDIGGTKTLIAVFTPDGEIVEKVKFPTPHEYELFCTTLADQLKTLQHKEFTAAGVAIPGRIDRENGVGLAFGNLPWKDVPIQDDFERMLRCPVILENDANLAGLSEALLVRDTYKKALYVTVSTGIGGVYIINGKIDPSTADMEFGHMLFEHNDRLMRWEEFASGKAIVAKYDKRASDIEEGSPLWYPISRNIAIGLIDLIATLTPEVIIIGGGVGTHLPKFKERLDLELSIYENPLLTIPPILQAQRPEEAVIYGGYELCKERYGAGA